jgi:hypothetical protein
LANIVGIDDERIKGHLDRIVSGTVEETLNALLDAEADRLCNAQRSVCPQHLQKLTPTSQGGMTAFGLLRRFKYSII